MNKFKPGDIVKRRDEKSFYMVTSYKRGWTYNSGQRKQDGDIYPYGIMIAQTSRIAVGKREYQLYGNYQLVDDYFLDEDKRLAARKKNIEEAKKVAPKILAQWQRKHEDEVP